MKTDQGADLQKLVADIGAIKQVLANSRPSLQLFFLPVHFRLHGLFMGLGLILIAGLFHLIRASFGEFGAAPEGIRFGFYGLIFAAWLLTGLLKIINWKRSIARVDSRYNSYSIKQALKEMLSFRMMHTYLLSALTMIFFVVYWVVVGQAYFVIPTLAIGIGLILHIIGNLTEINHYGLLGYWLLFWGLVIIVVGSIPGPLALILSFGLGFLIFSLHAFLKDPREEV